MNIEKRIDELNKKKRSFEEEVIKAIYEIVEKEHSGEMRFPLSCSTAQNEFGFEISDTNGWDADYWGTRCDISGKECGIFGSMYGATIEIRWGDELDG